MRGGAVAKPGFWFGAPLAQNKFWVGDSDALESVILTTYSKKLLGEKKLGGGIQNFGCPR